MDNRKILILSKLLFLVAEGVTTLIMINSHPALHKSFMLEIINVKLKK